VRRSRPEGSGAIRRRLLATGVVAVVGAVAGVLLLADGDASRAASPAPLGDEFDGRELDAAVWATCYYWRTSGCTNEWNGELQAYHPANATVADGSLHLTAREEPTTGHLMDGTPQPFEYSSGMVSGHRSGGFRFGYVEVRARVPGGPGLWPALWLLPADRVWPPEIDFMELIGDEPGVVHMALHAGDGTSTRFLAEDADYTEGWHTFAVDWRPGAITFLVDGEVHGEATEGVPDEPMYVIANLAVGGEWPGPPGPETELPATFEIDHIRIWPGTGGPPGGMLGSRRAR
jgi:beta-glucanase (GH16 family)